MPHPRGAAATSAFLLNEAARDAEIGCVVAVDGPGAPLPALAPSEPYALCHVAGVGAAPAHRSLLTARGALGRHAVALLSPCGTRVLGAVPRACVQNRDDCVGLDAVRMAAEGCAPGPGEALLSDAAVHRVCVRHHRHFARFSGSAASVVDSVWLTNLCAGEAERRDVTTPAYLYDICLALEGRSV